MQTTMTPLIARDIAQTTAEVFVEDIDVYMFEQDKPDRVQVSIRDYALPGSYTSPSGRSTRWPGLFSAC